MTTLESIEVVDSGPPRSGDAWSAIIGGAVAATAISLILLVLGAGLGLSVVSPWSGVQGAAQIAVGSVIWLIVVQWIASAIGGYLTGRMREQSEPSDEIFFRDTANGFLAWALATLVAAGILASVTATLVGATANVVGGAAAATAANLASSDSDNPATYYSDMLLRPLPGSHPDTAAVAAAAPNLVQTPTSAAPELRSEIGGVLIHGLAQPNFPTADVSYLAQVVAGRTGLPADAAQARVNDVIAAFRDTTAKAKSAADTARQQAAKLSIYMFLSLIVGAFIACAAAALGGAHRDERPSRLTV